MTIKERGIEIIEEFAMFDDWMDKYNYLIELGRDLEIIEDSHRDPQHLISGCQSRVWLSADYKDGLIYFKADSDAVITKGIVNLLIRAMSGQSPEEIINDPLDFLAEIGLKEHLSPTRANGLTSMVKQMKLYAFAFKAKHES
ncbi:SufE family protein [Lentimicrobium sp. L6]|uniref:SufE family protein n=1 Tax=Lentimicrobium sp. L6 TaxID=2735916 RepID=UPI001552A177|nr:SufE family protein [Lentimicrobium sp. L6]NPD85622.1 SufE family protein [Lentimicrobium sp. L6]